MVIDITRDGEFT
jgi:hypothetical protein